MRAYTIQSFISESSFRTPLRIVPSGWLQHAPFAFWLLDSLQPRTFVELGTHHGFSYFTVCQGVENSNLNTSCYAVDTWRGDEHAGFYSDDVYNEVYLYNNRYSSFSKLMRLSFDDAVGFFGDNSIDLLHIDGRHFYTDIKHDFETWLGKLSGSGVILFHDTNVRERDFGVWRFFEEVSKRFPSFEFLHGHGLGVIAVGSIPSSIEFLFKAEIGTIESVRATYSVLGARIQAFADIMELQEQSKRAHEGSSKTLKLVREELESECSRLRDTLDAECDLLRHTLNTERQASQNRIQIEASRAAMANAEVSQLRMGVGLLGDKNDDLVRRLSQQLRRVPVSHPPKEISSWRVRLGSRNDRASLIDDYRTIASSPLFDPAWYVTKYPDVAEKGEDPVYHYLKYGGIYPMSPGPYFDASEYLDRNTDVRESKANPLLHFIRFGALEGRQLRGQVEEETRPRSAYDAELRCLKEPLLAAENALFVTHSFDGSIKPHARHHVHALKAQGINVTIIVAVDQPLDALLMGDLDDFDGVYIRQNIGFDFGAWAHLLSHNYGYFASSILYLVNDSVFGPIDSNSFAKMFCKVRSSSADLVSLSDNREYNWHIQSFFLAVKRGALTSSAFYKFFADVKCLRTKNDVIQNYEIKLAQALMERGISIEVLFSSDKFVFPSHPDRTNATLFAWRQMLDAGFPYVKVMALRDAEALDVDVRGWHDILHEKGYNLDLIYPQLGQAKFGWKLNQVGGSAIESGALSVSTVRVAFVGPWNYGSGLGVASRGYVSALWHTDLCVNAHPISAPFHIHARVSPTVRVQDFAGRPDVAIVHLNPDAWPALMSKEISRLVESARFVIGLWVWEMSNVPSDWSPGIAMVNAIWAPSQYCADIFSKCTDVPIHVVPHVVPVDIEMASQSQIAEAKSYFHFSERDKIILFCFDGSSYLVRKNPFALIDAFNMSGLAKAGWQLVLKTKNLYEAPRMASELDRLVTESDNVLLINKSMNRSDLSLLMRAADIYASPHCSEGFGLTIAEAMAAGKHVVATDYGGCRDFLDDTCGYPVGYELAALQEDHGHYTSGNSWALVDRSLLAKALQKAAENVARCDNTIPLAARQRVASHLSAKQVGQRIQACLTELLR